MEREKPIRMKNAQFVDPKMSKVSREEDGIVYQQVLMYIHLYVQCSCSFVAIVLEAVMIHKFHLNVTVYIISEAKKGENG